MRSLTRARMKIGRNAAKKDRSAVAAQTCKNAVAAQTCRSAVQVVDRVIVACSIVGRKPIVHASTLMEATPIMAPELTGAASVPPAESRPAGRLIPAWIGVGNTN